MPREWCNRCEKVTAQKVVARGSGNTETECECGCRNIQIQGFNANLM